MLTCVYWRQLHSDLGDEVYIKGDSRRMIECGTLVVEEHVIPQPDSCGDRALALVAWRQKM